MYTTIEVNKFYQKSKSVLHKFIICLIMIVPLFNKRAQRALGRSPEKKGKGNSGANYREYYRGII